jgi:pyridinium-3,5-bisthiocarboxylic acid mononucleotide nickel chelatase
MKILYYDCFMGISGDMNLAALIDLGVDKQHLTSELKKLKINDEYELQIESGIKNGITGTKVDVILHHHHKHHHHDEPGGHHHHRHFTDIRKMIWESSLSPFVKQRSIETFEKIAVAEAKIHGTTIEKVHFHEVGATDSIVDIVGNAICIEYLKPDMIISSPLQVGGGMVKCDHGIFPVPAPATAEILKNIPIKSGLVQSETTTPTGAAIIATNAAEITESMEFTIEKTGYGLGTKNFDTPNVLRVFWGEKTNIQNAAQNHLIEANIDDMNPEMYTYLSEQLFALGADDVYTTAIGMKKNRPATQLSILCKHNLTETIIQFVLNESTTFGLRYFPVNKRELERKVEIINIDGMDIRIKNAYFNGKKLKYKPEYDDCARFAGTKGIPISQVYKLIEKHLTHTNGQ